ncbi:MAG: sugar transferase [bacterium]
MKRVELFFSALLVPVDFIMVVAAGLASYYLRFTSFAELRPVLYELPFDEYVNIVSLVAAVWIGVFAISGLYAIKGTRRMTEEFAKIFVACSTGVMLLIILIFFQRELFSSRFIILSGWVLSIVFVSIARIFIRLLQHSLFRKGIGIHNLALVGADNSTQEIASYLKYNPQLGFHIVEQYPEINQEVKARLEDRIHKKEIDEIIVADSHLNKKSILELIELSNDNHITFKYAADQFDTEAASLDINAIGGIPIIELRRTPLDGWGKIIKRTIDIFGAIIGLILISPITLVVAIIIKLDSPGTIFVKLRRIGQADNKFTLYKFRSMVNNAHELKSNLMTENERNDGPLFKMKNDPRITRAGKWLRKTSIDELPQLWNVLMGDMSLVGPRPHEPEEVAKYTRSHRALLTIKPGITGMAQISGRSELSFEEEVKLDIYYIKHWSMGLDIRIFAKTVSVVFSTRSAT